MQFENRKQAGKLLGQRLQNLPGLDSGDLADIVVIALPRGGVPVGAEIAQMLACPLELLVSKKISAPDNRELAIGAVTSTGVVVLEQATPSFFMDASRHKEAQEKQKAQLVQETKQLEKRWRQEAGITKPVSVKGKQVIVVDDGVATGMTTLAALCSLKQMEARKIVLACPVIPYDTYLRLCQECDYLLALSIPYVFSAVGLHYIDFHQVEDQQVVESLKNANRLTGLPAV